MITYVAEMTPDNYQDQINSKPLVIVDVWAPWCGPCKMLSPIIDQIAAEIGEKALVGKLNADEHLDLVKELGVRNLPTIIVYQNGQIVETTVGMKNKTDLLKLIEPYNP